MAKMTMLFKEVHILNKRKKSAKFRFSLYQKILAFPELVYGSSLTSFI